MYNFFVEPENLRDNTAFIVGADYNHIKNVLRFKVGERFLVSVNGKSNLCELKEFLVDQVVAEIVERDFQDTSLPIEVHLFQGLPKSDKFELIIQKAVELGVEKIIPVQTERCIVKLDDKKKDGKTARWNAIAESAAKQSKRTSIPKVECVVSFQKALEQSKDLDLLLVPYENKKGISATKEAFSLIKKGMKIGVIIGPEGGFSQAEIDLAESFGAKIISLGKRILRTETASITTLSALMLHAEIFI